jgi:hypothetical protein
MQLGVLHYSFQKIAYQPEPSSIYPATYMPCEKVDYAERRTGRVLTRRVLTTGGKHRVYARSGR